MTEEELDIAIEEIMKEIRESPDYLGQSCSANADTQCSQENHSSKGTCCGEKLHFEQNQPINEKNKIKDVVEMSNENNSASPSPAFNHRLLLYLCISTLLFTRRIIPNTTKGSTNTLNTCVSI